MAGAVGKIFTLIQPHGTRFETICLNNWMNFLFKLTLFFSILKRSLKYTARS